MGFFNPKLLIMVRVEASYNEEPGCPAAWLLKKIGQ